MTPAIAGDTLVLGSSNPVRDASFVGMPFDGVDTYSARGAAGIDGTGELVPGAPATLAVWQVEGELVVQTPDDRVAGWSTDPRAGVAGLPDLAGPDPVCLRTVVAGRTIFSR